MGASCTLSTVELNLDFEYKENRENGKCGWDITKPYDVTNPATYYWRYAAQQKLGPILKCGRLQRHHRGMNAPTL